MADVYFLVGLDDVTERFPAHKFVLSTASEVFHGQLHGHYEVPETILVYDTTPEIFKIVLGYIYTDQVDLTPENAFPVLYLAKKYLLNNLIGTTSQFVASAFTGPSIAKVFPHLHLVEGEHAASIWHAIDENAAAVIRSPEFLELSHARLCDLLRRNLNADEVTIFKSVVAWTKVECTR
ncbi:BTB/POZ domain-containing protein 3-like protein [Aphelenchoides avenae]|nr:BTB/POZ domain-containing protein 3-like protein [Aphelenchus avenae]